MLAHQQTPQAELCLASQQFIAANPTASSPLLLSPCNVASTRSLLQAELCLASQQFIAADSAIKHIQESEDAELLTDDPAVQARAACYCCGV